MFLPVVLMLLNCFLQHFSMLKSCRELQHVIIGWCIERELKETSLFVLGYIRVFMPTCVKIRQNNKRSARMVNYEKKIASQSMKSINLRQWRKKNDFLFFFHLIHFRFSFIALHFFLYFIHSEASNESIFIIMIIIIKCYKSTFIFNYLLIICTLYLWENHHQQLAADVELAPEYEMKEEENIPEWLELSCL